MPPLSAYKDMPANKANTKTAPLLAANAPTSPSSKQKLEGTKFFPYTRGRCLDKDGKEMKVLGFVPLWLVKWFFPMFLAGCGFVCQNFQLRIATYNYVHYMTQWQLPMTATADKHGIYHVEKGTPPPSPSTDIALSVGKQTGSMEDLGYGAIDDPLALLLAPNPELISVSFLDMLAAAFPFFFVVLAVIEDRLGTWTRIFLCFFFLSFGKGLFGWITIMPASDGWDACKLRLDTSVKGFNSTWYAQQHNYVELLTNTFTDPSGRLCADMMWSGHTYFVTIFALGLYEISGHTVRHKTKAFQRGVQLCVGGVAVGQQLCEMYFVILSRFHYSADILMAVIMTFLLYTNSFIGLMAKDWFNRGTLYEDTGKADTLKEALISNGDLFIPGCCTMCAGICMKHKPHGNQHVYNSSDIEEIIDLAVQARAHFEPNPSQAAMKHAFNMSLSHDEAEEIRDWMRMPSGILKQSSVLP